MRPTLFHTNSLCPTFVFWDLVTWVLSFWISWHIPHMSGHNPHQEARVRISLRCICDSAAENPRRKSSNWAAIDRAVHLSIVLEKTSISVPSTTWTQKVNKAGILWHVVITHRNPSISDVWVICDVFNLEKVDVHAESVFLPLLLSHCLVPSIAGLSRSVNTHLQILPPTLPFLSSSLLLISP